jgi:hypothetical protein
VSPVLLRPVREQLEHDRVIRLLYARWRRRFQVGINPGIEQNVAIGTGEDAMFPDVVLASLQRGHRLQAVVEVETSESVNNLEALSEWVRMARLRGDFHLFVPAGSVEAARRLCADHNIDVREIWSFHPIGDQVRFAMVHRAPAPPRPARRKVAPTRKRPPASPRKTGAGKRSAKPAKPARSKPAGRTRSRTQKRK